MSGWMIGIAVICLLIGWTIGDRNGFRRGCAIRQADEENTKWLKVYREREFHG